MSVTDHYPRKKRKLCLINKTPKRNLRSDTNQERKVDGYTPPLEKEIPLPRKNLKIASPNLPSSDESCVEIGWDNNSPSPSTILKSNKGRRKQKADISTLLKHFPKKRRCSTIKETQNQNVLLSTWMQENLATQSRCMSTRSSSRRLNSKRTIRQQDTINFNEELRKFAKSAKLTEQQDVFKSSRKSFVDCPNKKIHSPLMNNSLSDSLLEMGNFDDLLIEGKSSGESKSPAVISSGERRTPKSRNRFRIGITNVKKNFFCAGASNKNKNSSLREIPKNAKCNLKKTQFSSVGLDTNSIVPLPFNDELDDILSSQPDVLDTCKDALYTTQNCSKPDGYTKVKSNAEISCFYKEDVNVYKMKLMSTPKPETNVDLVSSDVMFDSLLLNFNEEFELDEEFKCKSQETPPRITRDQRKLRTRSHTSPFPLRNKNKEKSNHTNNLIESSSLMGGGHVCSNKYRMTSTETVCNKARKQVDRPTQYIAAKTSAWLEQKFDHPSSIGSHTRITDTCCNKFSLSNKGRDDKFVMNLSEICKENFCPVAFDNSSTLSVGPVKDLPLSSTQKCTSSEIERKKREALVKLNARREALMKLNARTRHRK